MGQEPRERKKGLGIWYAVIGLAVAAILVFTVLSVFYYDQAMDYRAAKYKAQYVLVQDILEAIPQTIENITYATDDELDTGWRRASALTSSALSTRMAEACHAIKVMYSATDEKNIVFSGLTSAFKALSCGAYEAYVELSSEFGPDEAHDISDELSDSLEEAISIIESMTIALETGVDYDRDWTSDPYDLLDGMNMVLLWSSAEAIIALFA